MPLNLKRLFSGSNSKSKETERPFWSTKHFFHEFEVPLDKFVSSRFNEALRGPRFICAYQNTGQEFQIEFFPKGAKSKCRTTNIRDSLLCCLRYVDGPWKKIDAFFLFPDHNSSYSEKRNFFDGSIERGGATGLVYHTNDINQLREEGLISKRDTLRLSAVVCISETYFDWESCYHQETETSLTVETSVEKECFFGPLFSGPSARCSTPPEGSDFLITVGESNTVFHCHRFVLQQKIPEFFNGMMAAGMEEAKKGTLDFPAFRSESVWNVLYFIYNNEVSEEFASTAPEIFQEILHLSEMLLVPKLKSECGKLMLEGLTEETLKQSLEIADKYHMDEVMKECLLLRTKQISTEKAVDLLIRSDKLHLEPIRNLAMNFVAENLQELREDLNREASMVVVEEVMALCQKRMIVEKLPELTQT